MFSRIKESKYYIYFRIYFCLFSIFLLIGIAKGFERKRDPDFMFNTIFNNIETGLEDGEHCLRYQCKDNALVYLYFIGSDMPVRKPGLEASPYFFKPKSEGLLRPSTLISFLGGSTGSFTLQKILKKTKGVGKAEKFAKIIVGITGAISGYGLGYWLSSLEGPNCSTKGFIDLLEQGETWKELEKRVWFENYMLVQILIKKLDEKNLSKEQKIKLEHLRNDFKLAGKRAEKVGYDFKNGDYEIVAKLLKFVTDIR